MALLVEVLMASSSLNRPADISLLRLEVHFVFEWLVWNHLNWEELRLSFPVLDLRFPGLDCALRLSVAEIFDVYSRLAEKQVLVQNSNHATARPFKYSDSSRGLAAFVNRYLPSILPVEGV